RQLERLLRNRRSAARRADLLAIGSRIRMDEGRTANPAAISRGRPASADGGDVLFQSAPAPPHLVSRTGGPRVALGHDARGGPPAERLLRRRHANRRFGNGGNPRALPRDRSSVPVAGGVRSDAGQQVWFPFAPPPRPASEKPRP